MNIDQELATCLWLADLNTTDHEQVQKFLWVPDRGFCCMGRAAVLTGVPAKQGNYEPMTFMFPESEYREESTPPANWFERAFGLDWSCMDAYIEMNDDGISFLNIALAIHTDLLKTLALEAS